MEAFIKDLKHSLRMFAQSPAFTLAAVAALTLGIGANTAIFSVVNAVLLRPIAFPDAERVVVFLNVSPRGRGAGASPAKFMHYRQQEQVVQDVSAFNTGDLNYTGGSFPEQLRSGRVTADFFKLTAAPVILGRTFLPEEDLPNGPRVVVISRQLWETRFNADPNIVGKSISLGGDPHTIVGVLGDFDFREFGPTPQVWTLFQFDPNTDDRGHYFQAMGRLKPGITLQQADARLAASAADYRKKFPTDLGPQNTFGVRTVRDQIINDDARQSLWIYGGAVSFVLLIACANVANLLLVRATGRRREIAIRAAIGGSRGRIIRQLLTESVVLSLAGGVFGLFLGWAGIRALLSINTAGLPRVGENGSFVGLDWRVVAFTVGVSLLTGVIFGLIPALQSSKTDLTTTLKEAAGRSGTGFRQNKVRSVLVVVEVGLALVLLIGSALLIRTAAALGRVDPGFDTQNVLTLKMSLKGAQFEKAEAVEQLVRNGVERLKAIPGVVAASATCCVPLQGGYGLPFRILGRPLPADAQGPFHGGGGWMTVSPGYFEVFKIPVRRGRTFNERDTSASTPVVVINEAMAKQYWPQGDPLNDRLLIGKGIMPAFAAEVDRQVIGIVADIRSNGLDSEPQPQMFIPQAQVPDAANALNVGLTPLSWIVRTQVPPQSLSNAIQDTLRQSTGLPVSGVLSMSEIASRSVSRQRFNMWVMTVFGGCALLLAAIGIYGLMAYSVEQRTQEIGIRLALGAQGSQVSRMIVSQGMALAIAGMVIGLGAAFYLARLIASFLFGVTAKDPMVFTAVPLLLLTVAFLSVWIPARRASRVDPLIALRYE
ncbi:MAG TPA: ABC transporter permease [Vicinamibacterales bacterium]|nr:ABC transporter permease [Vicinamibacterales bacterium]